MEGELKFFTANVAQKESLRNLSFYLDYIVASVRLLNFSLGYTKLVTPTGKYQHTLRKL